MKATYSHIVDKVINKLSNWKGKVLTYARKRTLFQSTLSSIPTYTTQTAMLPVSVCEHLDQCNRNFLWGGNVEKSHCILADLENVDHIFRWCPFVAGIWECIGRQFGVQFGDKHELVDWLFTNINKKIRVSHHGCNWNSLFSLLLWSTWKARNDFIFNAKTQVQLDVVVVVHFIKSTMVNSHPYYTLVKDCLELIKGDWNLEIRHIFRKGNRCADQLANMTRDALHGVTDAPPQQVRVLMEEDMLGFGTLGP
ncbi:hypothetical protein PVK06_006152 [Gossypium arboreum]|uniref:RNase H type-1 domain-containing protein n=1 Tax=Gossypium arboreum TaxID=29729 RepID=A0ABR0QXK2_GOSAR|nr:hypothetical protein PVK06_006152 [Gossypium arboreum]